MRNQTDNQTDNQPTKANLLSMDLLAYADGHWDMIDLDELEAWYGLWSNVDVWACDDGDIVLTPMDDGGYRLPLEQMVVRERG